MKKYLPVIYLCKQLIQVQLHTTLQQADSVIEIAYHSGVKFMYIKNYPKDDIVVEL